MGKDHCIIPNYLAEQNGYNVFLLSENREQESLNREAIVPNLQIIFLASSQRCTRGCMLFSPQLLSEYDGLDERTSLYYEERILFAKNMQKRKVCLYRSSLQIFYNQHLATSVAHFDLRKRLIFVHENCIHGLTVYREVLKDEGLLND